MNIFSLLLSTP